jgi:hypothetical protein
MKESQIVRDRIVQQYWSGKLVGQPRTVRGMRDAARSPRPAESYETISLTLEPALGSGLKP